jgi:hypothetical protein
MRRPLVLPLVALFAALPARGGERAAECLAAFAPSTGDGRRIRCVDGDPTCDADPTPGVCRFDVAVCLNVPDPALRCAPQELERYEVANVQPDTDPHHDFEFGALQAAVDALGFPIGAAESDVCTGPVAMILPLEVRVKKDGARYRSFAKTLRASTFGPGDPLDHDELPMKCLPAKASDPCEGVTSTLDQIERHVFTGCTRDTCHNAPGGGHTLTLLPGQAYANLVGVTPNSSVAADAGKLRVDPGNPDKSFLLDKLRGTLVAGEGVPMPRELPKLPARKIQLVEEWIAAGAPATGFVGGIGCGP